MPLQDNHRANPSLDNVRIIFYKPNRYVSYVNFWHGVK